MKPETATGILRDLWCFQKSERYSDEQIREALVLAMEALETHDDLCENLAWYINERQRLLKVIEYSNPHEGLQRTIQKALERLEKEGDWNDTV